jgi:hypothetical protein
MLTYGGWQSDDAREVGRLLALDCAVWQGIYNEEEVRQGIYKEEELPVGRSRGSRVVNRLGGTLGGPHLLPIAPLDTDGEAIRALELDKAVLLRGIMQAKYVLVYRQNMYWCTAKYVLVH